jgi:hypothetical protein
LLSLHTVILEPVDIQTISSRAPADTVFLGGVNTTEMLSKKETLSDTKVAELQFEQKVLSVSVVHSG